MIEPHSWNWAWMGSQAVAPVAARTAPSLFCWSPHRLPGDEVLRDFLLQAAAQAQGADTMLIAAPQRVIDVIDRTPSPVIMPSAHDRMHQPF